MKIFKNIIFSIGLYYFLLLSIEPMQMYGESWMIGSYLCHMCVLFLFFIIWGITHDNFSDEPYLLGANCTVNILLMLLSTYPFFLTSEKITDFIYKYWEYSIEPYEGGIIVTICVIISELYLLSLLCTWINLIKELQKQRTQKYSLLLGVLFPLSLIGGYATNIYIDYAAKDKEIMQREKKWEEERRIRKIKESQIDSIVKERAQKYVELSFGSYKLGTNKYEFHEGEISDYLLGEKIKDIDIIDYKDTIRRIIVEIETKDSRFDKDVEELYTKKYGETSLSRWEFKNQTIDINKKTIYKPYDRHEKMRIKEGNYVLRKRDHYIITIIYIDHKLDSIAIKEEQREKEQWKKEYERQMEEERKAKEEKLKKESQQEYDMI